MTKIYRIKLNELRKLLIENNYKKFLKDTKEFISFLKRNKCFNISFYPEGGIPNRPRFAISTPFHDVEKCRQYVVDWIKSNGGKSSDGWLWNINELFYVDIGGGIIWVDQHPENTAMPVKIKRGVRSIVVNLTTNIAKIVSVEESNKFEDKENYLINDGDDDFAVCFSSSDRDYFAVPWPPIGEDFLGNSDPIVFYVKGHKLGDKIKGIDTSKVKDKYYDEWIGEHDEK